MPTYDYYCTHCETGSTAHYPISNRPETIPCPNCTAEAEYRISSPMIFKASYLDGTKRFQDLKEAAKINKEAAHARTDTTRKEIASEIRKMGVGLNKD